MKVDKLNEVAVKIVLTEEESRWLMRLVQNDLSGTETIEDADMRIKLWDELHHAGISVL
jgi:hypothetical protein